MQCHFDKKIAPKKSIWKKKTRIECWKNFDVAHEINFRCEAAKTGGYLFFREGIGWSIFVEKQFSIFFFCSFSIYYCHCIVHIHSMLLRITSWKDKEPQLTPSLRSTQAFFFFFLSRTEWSNQLLQTMISKWIINSIGKIQALLYSIKSVWKVCWLSFSQLFYNKQLLLWEFVSVNHWKSKYIYKP